MIQRIQTVFLFVAFILISMLFFIPFAQLVSNDVYSLSLKGVLTPEPNEAIQQPIWLILMGAITSITIFICIFLYSNRKLQMKIILVSILLALGLNGLMYYITNTYKVLLNANINFSLVFVFPAVTAILLFLAYRAIKKDEDLIKSLDRIR
jgi:uncharacterized membrane protein